MRPVPRAASIRQGLNQDYAIFHRPFVVDGALPGAGGAARILRHLRERLGTGTPRELMASSYSPDLRGYEDMTLAQALDLWERGAAVKVLDSYAPPGLFDDLVPEVLRGDGAAVILSNAGSYTPLHIDHGPGGNWMYLASGRKRWVLASPAVLRVRDSRLRARMGPPEDKAPPPAPQAPLVDDVDDAELLRLAEATQTHVWATELGAGQLLYWPAGFLHRVVTPEAALGIGGHLECPHDTLWLTRLRQLYGRATSSAASA